MADESAPSLRDALFAACRDDLLLLDDQCIVRARVRAGPLADALRPGTPLDSLSTEVMVPLRRALRRCHRGDEGLAEWVLRDAGALRAWEGRALTLEGESSLYLVMIREVTERRRAEMGLAADKERLVVTLRSIQDGVVSTDREERVVLMNPAAEVLLGISLAEARGRSIEDVFAQGSTKALDDFGSLKELVQLRDPAGRVRSVRVSVAPVLQHGQLLGGVYALRDVTDERLAEQERTRASKLESVGLLAGGIAHDFNNLLAAILGNLSVARHYAGSEPELDEILDDIEVGARRATGLTRQLLTFSKGGAPMKSVGSIDEVVREAVDFGMRGSNVRHDYAIDDTPYLLEFDRGQIQQVLQNLVINACQAMPDGGSLQVTVRNELRLPTSLGRKPGPWVRVSLADDGVGIPPADQGRIFDPYFTTKSEGTGLGLATAYAIVRKHGGYMTVESEPGEGSTFHLYLPAIEAVPAWGDASSSSLPPRFAGRVLVMDDEPALRQVAQRLLDMLGVDVETCEGGEAAVSAYKEALEGGEPFDAVLLDLTIPGGMGGRETVIRLLDLDSGAVCIATSGYSTDPVLARFDEYGFRGRLAKPYDLAELADALMGLVPTEASAPPASETPR